MDKRSVIITHQTSEQALALAKQFHTACASNGAMAGKIYQEGDHFVFDVSNQLGDVIEAARAWTEEAPGSTIRIAPVAELATR